MRSAPRLFLVLALLLTLLRPLAAHAQDAATDTDTPAAAEPTPPIPEGTFSMGAGLAYVEVEGPRTGVEESALGVGLEFAGTLPFTHLLGIRLRLGWALTNFDRSARLIDAGTRAIEWTAGAYASVARWMTGGKDEYALFRFMGAIFAWTGLSMGFVVGGLGYVLSPFVATGLLELGASLVVHAVSGPHGGLTLEIGPGVGMFLPEGTNEAVLGFGPLLGLSFRHRGFGAGVHALWSPPALQTEKSDSNTTALAAMAVLSAVY